MTTSPMPPRVSVLTTDHRRDHYHFPEDAPCYFWGEYTSDKGWSYSTTNQLIANFKKKMDRRGRPEWGYKAAAIEQVATAFSGFWNWSDLHRQHRVLLVPMPPSKARGDAMYDPRMLQTLQAIAAKCGLPLDIRDCLSFSGRHGASHESTARPTPEELFADLAFDAAAGHPAQQPGVIFLFDDMLTTGAHYCAASRRLAQHFPGVQTVGNFVARRIFANPFEDADELDAL